MEDIEQHLHAVDIEQTDQYPTTYICHLILGSKQGLKRVRVRIDQPRHVSHGPSHGQQEHGHVEELKGNKWHDVQVLNRDGTGSHTTKRGDPIRKDVADVLRKRGWDISNDNTVKFLSPSLIQFVVVSLGCQSARKTDPVSASKSDPHGIGSSSCPGSP